MTHKKQMGSIYLFVCFVQAELEALDPIPDQRCGLGMMEQVFSTGLRSKVHKMGKA